MRVKSPARTSSQTARSEDEHTNHEDRVSHTINHAQENPEKNSFVELLFKPWRQSKVAVVERWPL